MIRIILLSLLLVSCASVTKQAKDDIEKLDAKEKKGVFVDENTPPMNLKILPGEVTLLEFKGDEIKDGVLLCNKKEFLHYHDGEKFVSYVSETYFSKIEPYLCTYGNKDKKRIVARVNVKDKTFPAEKLKVDQKRVVYSKKDLKRIKKEQEFLNGVYKRSPARPLFSQPFRIPLDSHVTSIYGTQRVFNNIKKGQHLGTDFRASVGTPITVANSGKVVVARDLFFSGNTVTIDHGMGIFTIYGHLSKLKTVEGEYVPRGALIGYAGATGRVTGPHLHWGVKVNGNFVDGASLVEATANLD